MTEARYPELSGLYRAPYTAADNPNVVIEPTLACNLSCAHCYRNRHNPANRRARMTLNEVTAYIDEALRLRKFHTLSFLGGEPLLYPELDHAVLIARKRGLAVGVFTNGELLHKYRARELQAAGVGYVCVHIDRHQGRTSSEADTTALHAQFCDIFRKLPGMNLGLGMIVHADDLSALPRLAQFCQANADVLRFVNLSLLGPVPPENATPAEVMAVCRNVDAFQRHASEAIRAAFGAEYCSYLGSKFCADTPGKLVAATAYGPAGHVEQMSPHQYAELCERFRAAHDCHPYLLSKACTDEFAAHSGRTTQNPWQYLVVSMSPLLLEDGRWNVCHVCTESVLHEHRFVPSCQLDMLQSFDRRVEASLREV